MRNERVRFLRDLVRDAGERRLSGQCVVEGVRAVQGALANGARVHVALVSPRLASLDGGPELRAALEGRAVELLETSDAVLASVSDTRAPQGVLVGVTAPRREGLPRADDGVLVVAWELQDPGNAGTIVRSAHAFGATAVVFAAAVDGALIDAFSPRAVRASAAACFAVPVHEWRCDAGDAAVTILGAGWAPIACVPREGHLPEDVDLTRSAALVIGSEGRGLPASLVEACASRVTIPLAAGSESLNAAMAATTVLAEASRQRRGRG